MEREEKRKSTKLSGLRGLRTVPGRKSWVIEKTTENTYTTEFRVCQFLLRHPGEKSMLILFSLELFDK